MKQFFGPYQPNEFLGYFLFALLGAALILLLSSSKRDPNASTTPFHFSLQFLLSDNVKRIVTTILLVYVTIRFSDELVGFRMNDIKAVIVGVCWDQLAQLAKDKLGILRVDRQKIQDTKPE